MVDPEFRQAGKQDIPVLAEMWLDLDRHVAASSVDAEKFGKKEDYRTFVVRWLGLYINSADASVQLAEVDGTIAGFISCQIQAMPWYRAGRIGLIGPCYIKPLYRRRRLGTRLVRQIESWLKDNDVEFVDVIWDYGNNDAEKFWYGIGYHCSQVRASKRLP